MPPKRRSQRPSTLTSSRATKAPATRGSSSRAAQLAKENDISIEEEAQIREAFRLFSRPVRKRRRPPPRRRRRQKDDDDPDEDMAEDDGEDEDDDDAYVDSEEGERSEGVIATEDVRRILAALNLPPSSASELRDITSTLDPDKTGAVSYEPFVSVCALKLEMQTAGGNRLERDDLDDDDDDDDDDEEEEEADDDGAYDEENHHHQAAPRQRKRQAQRNRQIETKQREMEEAFRLFTGGGRGPITVAHLKRVARELHQLDDDDNYDDDDDDDDNDEHAYNNTRRRGGGASARGRKAKGKKTAAGVGKVDDEMLRRMVLEANGNAGVARGVRLEDFKAVMQRAGVF